MLLTEISLITNSIFFFDLKLLFNIFLEIPLKIISIKMNYKIIPIGWKNRKEGKAKFNMKELRSKYLFTLILLTKMAEGMGFEPMRGISSPKRLAGARTRPLCDPSLNFNINNFISIFG